MSRKVLFALAVAGSALVLIQPPSSAKASNSDPRQQEFSRGGSSLADLLWELAQHLPPPPPQSVPANLRTPDYEFAVVEGTVVARKATRSSYENWKRHTLFPAWAETTVDVERAATMNSDREASLGSWVFVERHGFLTDEADVLYEPWWGMGPMRYNKLRVGDRAILVGIRKNDPDVDSPLYNSELWPHFSVVFNLLVRSSDGADRVCVVAPMGAATDEDFYPDGRVVRVVPRSEYTLRIHCFDVTPDEAFEAVQAAVEERALQAAGE